MKPAAQPRPSSSHTVDKAPPKLKPNPIGRPLREVAATGARQSDQVEHENVGVESGHKAEELAEHGIGGAIRRQAPSLQAEALSAYCALEDELQRYLDTYTRTHDYDEYHFDLDTIEHDPYVLLSIVCALHEGEWTLDEVRGTLQSSLTASTF